MPAATSSASGIIRPELLLSKLNSKLCDFYGEPKLTNLSYKGLSLPDFLVNEWYNFISKITFDKNICSFDLKTAEKQHHLQAVR